MEYHLSMERLFILDANFLIDILKIESDFFPVLCGLISIIVPRPIFDEVDSLSESQATELGIRIIDVDLELMIQAINISDNSGLSSQDAVALLIAKANDYSCVTNDKLLYNRCRAENIHTLWGLELLLDLVRNCRISKEYAAEIAQKLQEINIKMTAEIMREFDKQLNSI